MKINATEIRVGMILEYKNDLWEVLKTQHVKPGKGGAFAQIEMKSLNKNTKLNERFRSSETIEKASLEEIKFSFLYNDILGGIKNLNYNMEKDICGYMVMFPSALHHMVNPFYECDEERISISGNIGLMRGQDE